jgi:hypothetical protein
MPNKRLEVANKKPTAKACLFFTKEVKFLIMINKKRRCEPTIKLNSVIYFSWRKIVLNLSPLITRSYFFV